MSREENVINYYVTMNRLKRYIRSAWTTWNVQSDRLESIFEHVASVQNLAIAIYSEYDYDLDLSKVIEMLAIHEIGESFIEDITMFDMNPEEKEKMEHEAVHKILEPLYDGNKIEELFLEFDEQKSKEALFAFFCDKLECDLQACIYAEEGLVDLNNQPNNNALSHPLVKELLDSGESFKGMWIKFSQAMYPYDDNFKNIGDYALKHKITN